MATNKFKDSMGRWRTESLFVETNRVEDKWPSFYCLNPDKETELLPSLKRLYLEASDPTEYNFATSYLGGWQHWQALSKGWFFKEYIKEWREELEVKLRAEGIKAQRGLAKKGNPNAAKWLAEKGWDKRKAGAPSKEERVREMKMGAKVAEHLDEDYERVFSKH
jgi:hypothetical protein